MSWNPIFLGMVGFILKLDLTAFADNFKSVLLSIFQQNLLMFCC